MKMKERYYRDHGNPKFPGGACPRPPGQITHSGLGYTSAMDIDSQSQNSKPLKNIT